MLQHANSQKYLYNKLYHSLVKFGRRQIDGIISYLYLTQNVFVCVCVAEGGGGRGAVEVLRLSQPNGVMSSAVSLPNHAFTGQA